MSGVDLDIGGHRYPVACRPGQEGHFLGLARVIDAKAAQAAQSMGSMDATRTLLFAALLLADELGEVRANAAEGRAAIDEATLDRLEALAQRIEALAG